MSSSKKSSNSRNPRKQNYGGKRSPIQKDDNGKVHAAAETPKTSEVVGAVHASVDKGNTKGMNDVSWYALNDQMLKDSASLPFTYPTGHPVAGLAKYFFGSEVGKSTTGNFNALGMPGIMRLNVVTTIGEAESETAAVNVAAKKIYADIRYKVSGGRTYEPADVMMFILAMDQIYSAWTWMMRVYGLVNRYSQENKYLGDALIKAQGIDAEDLRLHLADFRYAMNNIAAQMNAIYVPKEFKLLTRHGWLFSNVYYDDPLYKGQMYVFVPAGLWKYSPKTSTKGGELILLKNWEANMVTLEKAETVLGYIQDMVNAVSLDTDIGTISGDIYKTYEASGTVILPDLVEDFKVEPVYNAEVLDQISNATITGDMVDTKDYKTGVSQSGALITSHYYVESTAEYVTNWTPALLNYTDGEANPSRNMVATRLVVGGLEKVTDTVAKVVCMGSDFVTSARIYSYANPVDITTGVTTNDTVFAASGRCMRFRVGNPSMVYLISSFNKAPAMYSNLEPTSVKHGCRFMDPRNLGIITPLTLTNLRPIHSTAILSLYNVPTSRSGETV